MSENERQIGLGELLADAQENGFFRWFHLRPVDDPIATANGAAWHRFRPTSERFHPLVELAAGVDAAGRIEAACLGIDRTFITTPSIRPFARDIARSFLDWILPAAAAAALKPSVQRIGAFCDGESTIIVHASVWERLQQRLRPGVAGDAADVFMGSAARSETKVGATRISFENLIEPLPQGVASRRAGTRSGKPSKDEEAWLRIAIAGKQTHWP